MVKRNMNTKMASKLPLLARKINQTEETNINDPVTPTILLKRFLPIKYVRITEPNPRRAEGNLDANSSTPNINCESAIKLYPNGGWKNMGESLKKSTNGSFLTNIFLATSAHQASSKSTKLVPPRL